MPAPARAEVLPAQRDGMVRWERHVYRGFLARFVRAPELRAAQAGAAGRLLDEPGARRPRRVLALQHGIQRDWRLDRGRVAQPDIKLRARLRVVPPQRERLAAQQPRGEVGEAVALLQLERLYLAGDGGQRGQRAEGHGTGACRLAARCLELHT